MRQLTIRGVPDAVADRLTVVARERGQSLNRTIVEILKNAVGQDPENSWLKPYLSWTEKEGQEFDRVLADQRVIDPGLWD